MKSITSALEPWFKNYFVLAALILSLLLASCGGEHSGSSPSDANGDVVIGLTDADGDFLAYIVDVQSIRLTRADGTVVETLPLSARLDFSQYTDMTEFLTMATIPAGLYTQARMRISYSNADIQVEANGRPIPANLVDTQGTTLSVLDVDVQLARKKPLAIVPGVPAHLTLDFDLRASHDVDPSVNPAHVVVEPILLADVNPKNPKIHRLRGPLQSINQNQASFQLAIRPFHLRHGHFGSLTVLTDSTTLFEVDGVTAPGNEGLQLLAAKPLATAVVAIGDLDVKTHQFRAHEVYAGSSVAWGDSDAVTGNVVARSGNTVTLRGATLVRADGSFIFGDEVLVQLGDDTNITKQGVHDNIVNLSSISIGQRLTVLGEFLNQQPGQLAMDATQGFVRLLLTTLSGEVNAIDISKLTINLQSIDLRPVNLFDFSGTGGGIDQTNPLAYEIDTRLLSLADISIGEPVRVRGFVNDYESTAVDFIAQTVMDLSRSRAVLAVKWAENGTTEPFSSTSATSLVLNINESEVDALHDINRLGVLTDLTTLNQAVSLTANDTGLGLFVIAQHGLIQLHTKFDLFEQELTSRLKGSNRAKALLAGGHFNDTEVTFAAGMIAIKLN